LNPTLKAILKLISPTVFVLNVRKSFMVIIWMIKNDNFSCMRMIIREWKTEG